MATNSNANNSTTNNTSASGGTGGTLVVSSNTGQSLSSQSNSGDLQFPGFANAGSYPTRCTGSLTTSIAVLLLQGASVAKAAIACGVTPARARQWMAWGRQAAERDANASDSHAPYLEFWLACSQAQARAQLMAEHSLYLMDPAGWLSRHPETRNDWGVTAGTAPMLDVIEVVEQEPVVPAAAGLPTDPDSIRTVIQMLIESGVALPAVEEQGGYTERFTEQADSSTPLPDSHQGTGTTG